MKYGIPETTWDSAKQEALEVLIRVAKNKSTIPYSELAEQIQAVELSPHDPRLFHLLGEISSEENSAGRGMLSVVVVHKSGDMKPGLGFFDLAKSLGYDVGDEDEFWVSQLQKVHSHWGM